METVLIYISIINQYVFNYIYVLKVIRIKFTPGKLYTRLLIVFISRRSGYTSPYRQSSEQNKYLRIIDVSFLRIMYSPM